MRNLGVSAVLVGLCAVSAANNWPGGVTATPWGEEEDPAPYWDVVYGPQDHDHPTSATIPGGTVANRPTYFVIPGGTQHNWTRTSVRPDLTFAGKFEGLTYAHGSTGTYYNTTGVWHARDYTPASGGSPGGD